MKKTERYFTKVLALTLAVIFVATSYVGNLNATTPKAKLGVFLSEKLIFERLVERKVNELSLDRAGILTIKNINNRSETSQFYIVIRHPSLSKYIPFAGFDERYNDGEVFESIDIQKVLRKAKVGYQLIIVPVDKEGKFENSNVPFEMNITGGGC